MQCKTLNSRLHAAWYKDDISEAKVARRREEHRSSNKLLNILRYLRKNLWENQTVQKSKTDYYNKQMNECSSDQKKLFQITKSLMNRQKSIILPTRVKSQYITESIAEYFTDKISKICISFWWTLRLSCFCSTSSCVQWIPVCIWGTTQERILSSNSKSCHLNPIHTSLLKTCLVSYTLDSTR